MRDAVYVAVGTIDPDKTLNDLINWGKLALILFLIVGLSKGARKHGDGDTKGAVSQLAAIAILAVGAAIVLNPFGIGTALLNVVV